MNRLLALFKGYRHLSEPSLADPLRMNNQISFRYFDFLLKFFGWADRNFYFVNVICL